MEQIVQTFTLGKSTVVTLPKSLGVKPGSQLIIQKRRNEIVLKLKKEKREKEIAEKIEKLSGGMNFKEAFGKELSPEELNELFDKQYEEMTQSIR